MTELKLPEIMLFGQKISLPDNGKILVLCSDEGAREATGDSSLDVSLTSDPDSCLISSENCLDDERENGLGEDCEILPDENEIVETQEDQIASESADAKSSEYIPPPATDETANSKELMESDDNSKSPSIDEETAAAKSTKNDCDQNDTISSEQKPLKKPDKILPCPRCNSMDTKFCYYNNYNVNQPRHFCKSCQRYWTAGGNMRNVPVGAGRRKSKNPNSYCRHITIPEALQAARIDVRNAFHHPVLKTNGRFLSFGSDMPLCESVASVLNIADKKALNGTMNGFYNLEQGIPIARKTAEEADNSSNGSSVTTSNSIAEKGKDCQQVSIIQNTSGFPNQIACLPGVPWPYPWNPSVPIPAICPPGFPMPFFPSPFWNCGVPGPWGIPLLSSPSSISQKGSGSGPNSPTLGKHSRDGDLLKLMEPEGNSPGESEKEGSILVPKTLRINDPNEAAKSSIWTIIGIKNESINRRGLFKGFQPKENEKNHVATFSLLSQANPAALSRSLSFQENA